MGLTHIYCGDGKGKTTAAVGLAVRAAGSGMRVHIVQLLKGNPTAELASLSLLPNITVDSQTYEVRIDGELITSEPADVLPMAQRYFLF